MRRMLAILFIMTGLVLTVVAVFMAIGTLPLYNRWADLLTLLAAFLFFTMALMLLNEDRAERESKTLLSYIDTHKLILPDHYKIK